MSELMRTAWKIANNLSVITRKRRWRFMTSANVIHFVVTEIESGKPVARYRQNTLCKDLTTEQLAKHQPPYLFHLLVNQPDENEADQTIYNGNLEDWLQRTDNRPLILGQPQRKSRKAT